MKIQNNSTNTTFTQLYIKSNEAQKLLKKADKAVKASNAKFINTNIPSGHRKPLWSVLSQEIEKRQANNPNNIIIDISNKAKQMLAIITTDNKGFLVSKTEVCPLPQYGSKNDMFPTNDLYRRYCYSFDQTVYGRSDFFDAIDNAEYEVDLLKMKQQAEAPEVQTSIRAHEKHPTQPRDPKVIKNPRRHEKARLKFKEHIQRPFEQLKSLIDLSKLDQVQKPQPKHKEKLPRKLKKMNSNEAKAQ